MSLQQIFWENVGNSCVIPFMRDLTLSAMLWFSELDGWQTALNLWAVLLVGIFGGIIGCWFNFHLGKLLANLRRKYPHALSEQHYERAARIFHRYAAWSLLFYWQPLGVLLPLLAGFLGMRWWMMMGWVLLGGALHRGSFFLNI